MLDWFHPQHKSYPTLFICVPLLLVGHYDFLRSSIGKFGFFIYTPRFLKRGQDKFRGTFQKYY